MTDIARARLPHQDDDLVPVATVNSPKAQRILDDIQSQPDDREIAIEQVGVSALRYPITVLDRAAESQRTIAKDGGTV